MKTDSIPQEENFITNEDLEEVFEWLFEVIQEAR